jgi:hypothetical protein
MRRKRVQESRVHEVRENIPSEWRRKEDLEQEASSGKRGSIPRDQGAIGQYPSPPDDSLPWGWEEADEEIGSTDRECPHRSDDEASETFESFQGGWAMTPPRSPTPQSVLSPSRINPFDSYPMTLSGKEEELVGHCECLLPS